MSFGKRDVVQRIVVTGALELHSPCCLGASDWASACDRPLARDGMDRPYLPGTSLAGVFRALLASRHDVDELLGYETEGDGCQARLLFSDAPVVDSRSGVELRDGVAIDPALGVAQDKKKFDFELLPVGTRFPLRLELLVPEDVSMAKRLKKGLVEALAYAERGLELGGRTRRGLGRAQAVLDPQNRWRIETYHVARKEGMLAWLGSELDSQLPSSWPRPELEVTRDAAQLARAWSLDWEPVFRAEQTMEVRLDLRVAGAVIVRSAGLEAGDADHRQLTRQEGSRRAPVLPGTSLAGVLRHRCSRIARTLMGDDGSVLVEGMFGPRPETSRRSGSRASRVRVEEASLVDGKWLRHTRVRIDPWTGGAAEHLMFTEDLLYGAHLEPVVRLEPPPDARDADLERALLLLALRDLATGDLPVGGEGAVGRGRLAPRTAAPFARIAGPFKATLTLQDEEGTVRVEPEGALREIFKTLEERMHG